MLAGEPQAVGNLLGGQQLLLFGDGDRDSFPLGEQPIDLFGYL